MQTAVPVGPAGLAVLLLALNVGAQVVPPHSTVGGKTMAEWNQAWCRWIWSLPENTANNGLPTPVYEHPLYDVDGSLSHLGNTGDMFFLGGVYRLATDPAAPGTILRTRKVTVPEGMRIFFPVIDAVSSWAGHGRSQRDPDLIGVVNGNMNLITDAHASLDGATIPDVPAHREPSGIFEATFGPNNIYGVPAERQGMPWRSYADGYWIMLDPLLPGEHTINFGGAFGPPTAPIFAFDVTYNVTVTPEPGARLLLAGSTLLLVRKRRAYPRG